MSEAVSSVCGFSLHGYEVYVYAEMAFTDTDANEHHQPSRDFGHDFAVH